jgi:hypothetical protein
MSDTRPCTCAPDERPYPCQHQYALGECRKAYIRALRVERDATQRENEALRKHNTNLVEAIHRLHEISRGLWDGSESEIADVINAAIREQFK